MFTYLLYLCKRFVTDFGFVVPYQRRCKRELRKCVRVKVAVPTLRASLSGTFLQTSLPDLVTPLAFMLLNVHGGETGLLGTGTEWEEDERVTGSTAETSRKRPERPWTAARTMEVLRRCSLAIAQRLVYCAIAVSTAVLDRVTKTMSVALLLTNNLDNSKQKTPSNLLSPAPPPYS